jgi:16S rRNA (cytosine1402-N4)-methyltransferase
MRADTSAGSTAATVVNTLPEDELADIFYRFGEERSAKKIAGAIAESRRAAPIATTSDLVEVLAKVTPGAGRRHPATRVFQALPTAVDLLAPGGRIFVISYHSLEDRIVKEYFRRSAGEGSLELLHKRVIKPSQKEVSTNPAARSARLRTAEKL